MGNQQVFIVVAALLNLVCLAAYSDSSENSKPLEEFVAAEHRPVMNTDAEVEALISETLDGRILVAGSTNLPDGTNFVISLENEVLGFAAQDMVSVDQGMFSSASLGPKRGLVNGNYSVEILMPFPFTQSTQVQKFIGSKGEFLTGPLVEKSEFGGNIVTLKIVHSLGSPDAILQGAEDHYLLVASIFKEATSLLNKGRGMNRIRQSDEIALMEECGREMREHRSSTNTLQNKAEQLSGKYIRLRAALIELKMCVTCSRSAMKACDRADVFITEQNEI